MAVLVQPSQQLVPAGTWSVDRASSSIEFRVRHFLRATVSGRFTEFEGELEVGADGLPVVRGAVQVGSLVTDEPKRDEHLRSREFFDVAQHPTLSFASAGVEPLGDDSFRIVGDLTLRGVTRPLELVATVLATGAEHVAIEARGELDRTDFGLTWNTAIAGGGALVSDVVRIEIAICAVRGRR